MKTLNYNSKKDLKSFLDSLSPDDYNGKKTKLAIRNAAKEFLESEPYTYGEKHNGVSIHNCLLCLVYDNI